ncbi:MAG: hypothetical protein IJV14_01620 [Lachnospiraceae bacterium]|nr:hypothetical protein [Lachnospiraceae bacterium]
MKSIYPEIGKRKALSFLLLFCVLLLSSCGRYSQETEALEEYRTQMEDFFDKVSAMDERIRSIDTSSETAEQEFLSAVDMLTSIISDATVLDPPDLFPDAKTLLEQAAQQMSASRKLYHETFEGETFDAETFNEAEESFKDCNNTLLRLAKYLQSIADDEL